LPLREITGCHETTVKTAALLRYKPNLRCARPEIDSEQHLSRRREPHRMSASFANRADNRRSNRERPRSVSGRPKDVPYIQSSASEKLRLRRTKGPSRSS